MKSKAGLFVSFEGMDRSGKSTQIELLVDYLGSLGVDFVLVREPGGTFIGEKIREILLDPVNHDMASLTEMMLYAASRAQLVREVIQPALADGKFVICDRYVDSSLAYQGFGLGLRLDWIGQVNGLATEGLTPDLTFYFDVDFEVSQARRAGAVDDDRIEQRNRDYHERVRSGYLQLVSQDTERWVVLDGALAKRSLFSLLLSHLTPLL